MDTDITIRNAVIQELTGDKQKEALDFVSFLQAHDMEFVRGDGYWANQYYWYARYKSEDVCYILVNGKDEEKDCAPLAIWSETSDSSDCAWYEKSSLDEHMKEIAWKNVDICGRCSPDSPCFSGMHKVIFGKEFEHVCRCTFRFDQPDADELECAKKLFEIRIKDILVNQKRSK